MVQNSTHFELIWSNIKSLPQNKSHTKSLFEMTFLAWIHFFAQVPKQWNFLKRPTLSEFSRKTRLYQ